MKFISSSRTTI